MSNLSKSKTLKSKNIEIKNQRPLDSGEIINHYQPQYDIKDMKIIGVEVLSRLYIEGKGLLYPDMFMSDLIKSNSSRIYFLMVLEKAISELKELKVIDKLSINVNISALTGNIASDIYNICSLHRYNLENITLELTEDEKYHLNKDLASNIKEIVDLGIKISMDDFGKDSACLQHFIELPFSELKIDQHLVHASVTNTKALEIIRLCVMLGKNLCIRVVAEGIEDMKVLNKMRELGVTFCQGYYMSKPLTFTQLKNIVV